MSLLTSLATNVHAHGKTILLGGALAYLSLVKLLRWRRYKDIHRRFETRRLRRAGSELRSSVTEGNTWGLTPEEAQIILQESQTYDMPMLLNYALAFALFKTYAIVSYPSFILCSIPRPIHVSSSETSLTLRNFVPPTYYPPQPSISKLLLATEELSSSQNVSKRYADVSRPAPLEKNC